MGLIKTVISQPLLISMVTALISLGAIWAVVHHIKVNNSLEMFTPPDSDAVLNREHYRDMFGRDDLFMISARGDVFTESFLSKLKALEAEISALNLPIKSLGQRFGESAEPKGPLQNQGQTQSSAEETLEALNNEFELGEEDDWGGETEGSIVEETTSLVSARRTTNINGSLSVKPWFDPIPSPQDIIRLKSEALSDPLLAKRLVNSEGNLTVIMVRVMFMSDDDMQHVFKALSQISDSHQAEGFTLRVTGTPAVNAALNEIVLHDLSRLLGFSGLAMFLALLYLFRAPLMVIGPIVVVAISVIWTMGFMALMGMSLNLLSSILPAFLLCVGLGDSIHLQSIFRTLRREGVNHRESIIVAGGMTGPPILFTSLTTMIGLLSFKFASVTAIQEMGIAGGIGVIFALLHSLITLPLFLLWQGDRHLSPIERDGRDEQEGERSKDRIDVTLNFLVRLSEGRRGRVAVLFSGLILFFVAIFGASRLEVWHDDLETLPNDHPIKSAVLEVDRELGGVANIQIVINADSIEGGVKNIHLLHALESMSKHLLNYVSPQGEKIVGHALSVTNIVKETRRALIDQDDAYRLPTLSEGDPQREASQLMSLFELQSPEELRRLTTIDLRHSHLTLQVKWQEATSYTGLIDHVQRGIKLYFTPLGADQVELKPTGGVYLAYTIITSLLGDLVKSFLAAFAVITLLMILMLRGLKMGLLAMIPNLFPILLMIGTLGLVGIPLDLNNLLIASIALGIAVDDTIHLLHHFQVSLQRTGDRELAIHESVTHAGRAMLSTSILLCVGFSVYLFASIEAVSRFGVIIGSTVMVAFFVDLLICPAILRVAYPPHVKQSA